MKYKRAGRFDEAEREMVKLASMYPKSAELKCALGGIYYNDERYELAETQFGNACGIAPELEIASLGLFHSLWRQGRKAEALDEARRYLSLTESSDYREILAEFSSDSQRSE